MGKRLSLRAGLERLPTRVAIASAAFACVAACGGSIGDPSPGDRLYDSLPPAAPITIPPGEGDGPERIADGFGAPSAIAMTPDRIVFTTSRTLVEGSMVDAGALFVAQKHPSVAIMIALDGRGAMYDALTTDGTYAFVATSDGRILATPLLGGATKTLATLDAEAAAIITAGDHVYFASPTGEIARVAKTGGKVESLGKVTGAVRGLEADDVAVYVATGKPDAPAAGEGGEGEGGEGEPAAEPSTGITRIALAADHAVTRLARGGEPCAMVRSERKLLWTSLEQPIAKDGTRDASKGAVLRLSLEGGAVATVASGSFSACALAADGASLWFATTVSGALTSTSRSSVRATAGGLGLMRAPIAGGAPVVVSGADRALSHPGAVAVDTSHVYWLTSTAVLRTRK